MRPAVVVERVVDPVGQPEQRELAQGGQVADPEVRRQRGVDLLGAVDVAVRHPAAQRVGGHVHELDLVGGAHHVVGHGLALADAGDPLHLVVDRLQVLDVDGGDDVDPGGAEVLDVGGALLVPAAGHVGVRELVDQHHGRLAGEDGVGVHLGEASCRGRGSPGGDDLQALELRGGVRAAVRLDVPHHDVGARGRCRRWASSSIA